MTYFDNLSQGSQYHEAQVLADGSLYLTVADIDNDECLRGFQSVISEAENHGYAVTNKHRYTQRDLPDRRGPIYDAANVKEV